MMIEKVLSYLFLSTFVLTACDSRPASRSDRNGIDGGVATRNTNDMPEIIFQIGAVDAQDGRSDEVFGKIRDLAVDTNGNIFLLDQQALAVEWFGSDGNYRGGAGRKGAGPGEFRAPMAIELDSRGRIHVLDAAYRRISIFAPSDSGLILEATRQIPVHAIDFCIIAGRYYFLAPGAGGIIHEVTYVGSLLRLFGAFLGHVPEELTQHSSIIQRLQNRGRLACTASPPAIVMLHEQLPVVRAFALDGSLLWKTTLKNYNPVQWEVGAGGGGLRMAVDPALGSVHTGKFITPIGNSRIAATIIEVDPVELESTFELRILSVVNGRQISARDQLFTFVAVHDSVGVGFKNKPFPKILGIARSDLGFGWE